MGKRARPEAQGGSGAAVCQFLCGDANIFNRGVSVYQAGG
jgi:hypothetical protein